MDNIINLQDRKKQNGQITPKEDMIKTLNKMIELVEKDEFSGFLAIGMGKENKIYSVCSGEFDVILAVGGMETLKHHLVFSTSDDEID